MSKRFLLRSASLLTFVAACAAGMPACSGSSDSTGVAGSAGGGLMDAGPKETGTPDTSTSQDAQPEASTPDVSQEADSATPDVASETTTLDAEALEGSLYDLSLPDVLLGDSGASLQGCYECSVDKCSNELSACEADAKCRTLVLCMFEDSCFDPTASQGVDMTCAMGCATKAGVSGFTDPAVGLGLGFAQCIGGECQSQCGVPDGGVPLDAPPEATPVDVIVQDVASDIDYSDVIPPEAASTD